MLKLLNDIYEIFITRLSPTEISSFYFAQVGSSLAQDVSSSWNVKTGAKALIRACVKRGMLVQLLARIQKERSDLRFDNYVQQYPIEAAKIFVGKNIWVLAFDEKDGLGVVYQELSGIKELSLENIVEIGKSLSQPINLVDLYPNGSKNGLIQGLLSHIKQRHSAFSRLADSSYEVVLTKILDRVVDRVGEPVVGFVQSMSAPQQESKSVYPQEGDLFEEGKELHNVKTVALIVVYWSPQKKDLKQIYFAKDVTKEMLNSFDDGCDRYESCYSEINTILSNGLAYVRGAWYPVGVNLEQRKESLKKAAAAKLSQAEKNALGL